jgi:hypothetical protein
MAEALLNTLYGDRYEGYCPFFPGEKILHRGFEDPSEFTVSEEEMLKQVRRVRDETRDWIKEPLDKKPKLLPVDATFYATTDIIKSRRFGCYFQGYSELARVTM